MFLTWHRMDMSGQVHTTANYRQVNSPSTQCVGGWMGHRVSLDALEKRKISIPCQESKPDHFVV
jgi:hypothetical protein